MSKHAKPKLSFTAARFLAFTGIIVGATACASTPSVIAGRPELAAASRRLDEVVQLEKDKSLTWDVTKRGPSHRPWLASDDELRFRLDALRQTKSFTEADQAEATAILDASIARAALNHDIALQGTTLGTTKRVQVESDLAILHDAERARLSELSSARELRRWSREFYSALPSANPNGGRTARMLIGFPAVPFLYTWIWHHVETEDKGPYPHDFEVLRTFDPDTSLDAATLAHLATASDEELLKLYAPTLVQQVTPDADYPADDDRIGAAKVYLTSGGEIATTVDTGDPVVYTRTTNAMLNGSWHRQLNYSVWYPEHPAMKSGDPEAGHTEGVLIRFTLDDANHPIIAETCFACGCFHRVFPIEALERAATEQFGGIESGRSPLAKKKTHLVDAIIPQNMGSLDPSSPHPVVYLYGGKHFAGAVEFNGYHAPALESIAYQLRSEETLEALPLAGPLRASFFQRDGLVRGADRPESTMLYATGFYHAGTPRIHDAHLIHFDQYDYNDPLLLEKLLRIPSLGGVPTDSTNSRYNHTPGAPTTTAPPPSEDTAPRAAKKAFFCPC